MANKLNINFIIEEFKKVGYTLISKNYKNSKYKLSYKCYENHVNTTTWNNFQSGYRCPDCAKAKKFGCTNPNYKGNVVSLKLSLYKTYHKRISIYEEVVSINENDLELLGVGCLYCNKFFVPTIDAMNNRLASIEGRSKGENNFYCSSNCKKACPTFWAKKYPKGFKKATSREVQAPLRKLVLERDGWACQKCSKDKDVQLHCHHFEGIKQNPIESADIDNCITLCKTCHKEVHKQKDCTYNNLKCK